MMVGDRVDPTFVLLLSSLAGSNEELSFERRGTGDSTYGLHGQVVAVNRQGTIQIRRTRTHMGEVHEMGLRYFLSATRPNGIKIVNRVAIERNDQFRAKQVARENEVTIAMLDDAYRPSGAALRSLFNRCGVGSLEGYASERYIFSDLENTRRRVGLIAKSLSHAQHFMSRQDIFMPLDDMLVLAIKDGVLWPACIAYDKQDNPHAWTCNWHQVFEELAGIPQTVLEFYLGRIQSGHAKLSSRSIEALNASELNLLVERGLLQYEASAQTLVEITSRISMSGLREFLRNLGLSFKSAKREALEAEIQHMVAADFALEPLLRQHMRSPCLLVMGPAGMSAVYFASATRELRNSIFLMRQWLRNTFEVFQEDRMARLAEVA